MIINQEAIGNCVVLRPRSRTIDAASAADFKNSAIHILNSGTRNLVVDLSEVEFIDSSGLGALVCIYKHIGTQGSLAISGVMPAVERMFRMTRMDRVFRLCPSVEAAVNPAPVMA